MTLGDRLAVSVPGGVEFMDSFERYIYEIRSARVSELCRPNENMNEAENRRLGGSTITCD